MAMEEAELKETVMLGNSDILLAYSEWLDTQGLVKGDDGPDADKRTHQELVDEFLSGSVGVVMTSIMAVAE